MKKTIGFIDYYIGEWHANHYPQWVKDANEKLGTDYEVKYVWAEEDVSPVNGITTDQWCEKMGTEKCESIAELCEKSDVIMILAPTNPEKHLQYAKEALKCGKRTYIDKTFAPDLETAEEIFRVAKEYNAPFFSTSALRYADELEGFSGAKDIILTGGGSNFNEYAIHTVEMAVVLLKSPVEKVKVEALGDQRICRLVAKSGTEAAILYSAPFGFAVSGKTNEGKYVRCDITSKFFVNLIAEVIRFYESGNLPFDSQETLEAMRVRDALLKGEKSMGEWIEA